MSRFLKTRHIHVILEDHGIRDARLAEPAGATPQAHFGGELLHDEPIAQSAVSKEEATARPNTAMRSSFRILV